MLKQKTPIQSAANFQSSFPESAGGRAQFGQPSWQSSISSGSQNRLSSRMPMEQTSFSAQAMPLENALMAGSNCGHKGQTKGQSKDQTKGQIKGQTKGQRDKSLVGIIDVGFGPGQHGRSMLKEIQSAHTDSQIFLDNSAGKGSWEKGLTRFVNTAKASKQPRAVANLSFDLTQRNPDGSAATRYQLTAPEKNALSYAQKNNVLVVASSGNQGGPMSALGQASKRSDNLIIVGAAEGKKRAYYSSFGQGLDFLVPSGKKDEAGTSFSAAKTTGAIAKLWQANSHLTPQQVVQALEISAKDLNTPGWDATTGLGLLNPKAAISIAKALPNQSLLTASNAPKTSKGAGSSRKTRTQTDSLMLASQGSPVAGERPASLGWLGKAKSWAGDKAHDIGNGASKVTQSTREFVSRNSGTLSSVSHGALGVAGFIPVVGTAADVLNGTLYAATGDWKNASLAMTAAIPVVGDAAAATRDVTKIAKAYNEVRKGTHVAGKAGKYATYTLKDSEGVVRYVGRSSGNRLRKREGEHLKKWPSLKMNVDAIQNSSKANRGAEEVLYSRHQTYLPRGQSLRAGDGTKLNSGANKGGRQLLNNENPTSNKLSKQIKVRDAITAYSRDLKMI